MKKTTVLIVDDSVVIRRILRDAISADPELAVVGVAANGRIALTMIDQVSPDIITLDLEMPEMDGLEFLRHLRGSHPKLPVIMFSTLTQRGAIATLDALALGARDYVTKPANVGIVKAGVECICSQILPRIKAICGRSNSATPSKTARQPTLSHTSVAAGLVRIVAIGSSTGGPNALAEVLPQLPADFPVPVVVVQHMPPTFTRFLAERLNNTCQVQVVEATSDQELAPGKVYIAPGDFHISTYTNAQTYRLRTDQRPPENSCRPAVDVLFRSVADTYRNQALAVILTGMGQDGFRGAQNLRQAGSQILAQDEASSVVWGMPSFVAEAGLADRVLPLPQIGTEIVRRVMFRHSVAMTGE